MTLSALVAALQTAATALQAANPGLFITVMTPPPSAMVVRVRFGMTIGLHSQFNTYQFATTLASASAASEAMSAKAALVVAAIASVNVT